MLGFVELCCPHHKSKALDDKVFLNIFFRYTFLHSNVWNGKYMSVDCLLILKLVIFDTNQYFELPEQKVGNETTVSSLHSFLVQIYQHRYVACQIFRPQTKFTLLLLGGHFSVE